MGMSTITNIREEISTIVEEPSILETSRRSTRSDQQNITQTSLPAPPTPQNTSEMDPNVSDVFGQSVSNPQIEIPEVPSLIQPQFEEDGPPSIAPFSVGPQSVGPPSVGPPSAGPVVSLTL